MYKKVIWIVLLVLGVISSVVFIAGFIISLFIASPSRIVSNTKIEINSKPSSTTKSATYNILIMGDSLAKATGDEKGLGFTNDFVNLEKLKTTKNIKVDNIAVNGDKSIDLLQILDNKASWQAIENSEIIFISIGGNEIKQFESSDITMTAVSDIENKYIDNLKNTYKLIRSKNKTCTIIFIGLYNPFGKDLTPDKLKLLNTWNYNTQEAISDDTSSVFIPTYDLFKYSLQKYLSVDNFHPNSAGYEAISKRVAEALKNY